MKLPIAASVVAVMLGVSGALAPAFAGQSEASAILFGRSYDDGVSAVHVGPQSAHYDNLPIAVIYATPNSERRAQARVNADQHLRRALSLRGIALHNVIEVETAANGNHILYYR